MFVNNISCLYPTYVRGEAYLAAGQGNAAATEFQKIIDHSGIVWNCWTGALAIWAWLGPTPCIGSLVDEPVVDIRSGFIFPDSFDHGSPHLDLPIQVDSINHPSRR
jgi:hypothetical protein